MGILSVSNYSILPSIAGGLGVSFTEKKSKKTDTPGKPPKYPLF